MKLAIIGGAGVLGSTAAFYAGHFGLLKEIRLIDVNHGLLLNHVMDMTQALSSISRTRIVAADADGIADCEIVLLAASRPERGADGQSRRLRENLSIVTDVCQRLMGNAREQILICATEPVDALNYITYKITGWDRFRCIGLCMNDTVRMRWALAAVLGLNVRLVDALCIGGHGEGNVPLFGQVKYDGRPLFIADEQQRLARQLIENRVKEYQALKSGRTEGWTSAVSLTAIIAAIVHNSDVPIPCSAVLEQEYGQSRVSAGVPCLLGRSGIREIMDVRLSEEQEGHFRNGCDKIRGLIASAGY